MTTNRIEEIQAGLLDDLRDGISFDTEQMAGTLAEMVAEQAEDRPGTGSCSPGGWDCRVCGRRR